MAHHAGESWDAGEYRLDEVIFGPAEQRLIRAYVRALRRLSADLQVPQEKLYYAAASAAECLRHGRDDARLLMASGAAADEIAGGRDTARADADFYLDLARSWIGEAGRQAA